MTSSNGIEQTPSIISTTTNNSSTRRTNIMSIRNNNNNSHHNSNIKLSSRINTIKDRSLSSNGSSAGMGTMIGTIGTKPTLLEVGPKLRFLIMDAPRQANLHLYIKEMRKHSVTTVVRVCEPTYQTGELQTAGISVHNMEYPDGHSPPQNVIDEWLKVVDKVFYDVDGGGDGSSGVSRPCIAVHCVAGLGRAPVMVAIALIEFDNMDPVDAVSLIRRHRRGAINEKQLLYLEGYKKSYHKKNGGEAACCVIS